MIKDTGERREFTSGAVRDIAEGKGRCDLLPLKTIGEFANDYILYSVGEFLQTGDRFKIVDAIKEFALAYFDNLSNALIEVSKHYEEGCQKYGERNWEKGIPLHCYVDSGIRHYLKFMNGEKDERHDRAFVWNMLGLLWTFDNRPEMNDLPFAENIDLFDAIKQTGPFGVQHD